MYLCKWDTLHYLLNFLSLENVPLFLRPCFGKAKKYGIDRWVMRNDSVTTLYFNPTLVGEWDVCFLF